MAFSNCLCNFVIIALIQIFIKWCIFHLSYDHHIYLLQLIINNTTTSLLSIRIRNLILGIRYLPFYLINYRLCFIEEETKDHTARTWRDWDSKTGLLTLSQCSFSVVFFKVTKIQQKAQYTKDDIDQISTNVGFELTILKAYLGSPNYLFVHWHNKTFIESYSGNTMVCKPNKIPALIQLKF